jgi:hypothetical protein
MMVFLVILLIVLAAVAVSKVQSGRVNGDLPARIVAAGARRLPAQLGVWGRAMDAELAHVQGRARRWRFAVGVLRVVVFPPPRSGVRAVAVGGLSAAAAATVITARRVPTLTTFVAVLAVLLTGYALLLVAGSRWPRPTAARVLVAAVAAGGLAAGIAPVVRVAVAHPAATADGQVFAVLFALAVTVHLAMAVTPPGLPGHADTPWWWAPGAALAGGAVWATVALLTHPASDGGIARLLEPVTAAVVLTASAGATVATGSRRTGGWAGVLALTLAGPLHLAITLTTETSLHQYTLTDPYDIAAYPHSGFPDVASYVLSDVVAGNILTNLVLYPLILLALAPLGAAAGNALTRRPTENRA